nr:hypothetical protein [Streptomyces sp. TS71-3]
MIVSSSLSGLSSTSSVDSSNSWRICMPRSRALARAVSKPATTWATGSMTTAYTASATQFWLSPTSRVRYGGMKKKS